MLSCAGGNDPVQREKLRIKERGIQGVSGDVHFDGRIKPSMQNLKFVDIGLKGHQSLPIFQLCSDIPTQAECWRIAGLNKVCASSEKREGQGGTGFREEVGAAFTTQLGEEGRKCGREDKGKELAGSKVHRAQRG